MQVSTMSDLDVVLSTLTMHLCSKLNDQRIGSDWCVWYVVGDVLWLSWSYWKRLEHKPVQWSNNGIGIVNSYSVAAHVTAGVMMWMIGFCQFRVLKKGSICHKYFGWFYVFCSVIGCLSGLVLSLHHKFTILTQYILITGSIHLALRTLQAVYAVRYSKSSTTHEQLMLNQWKHSHSILFHRVICELIHIIFLPHEPLAAINYGFYFLIWADLQANVIHYLDVYIRVMVLCICVYNDRFHVNHNEW
eukprot:783044_1